MAVISACTDLTLDSNITTSQSAEDSSLFKWLWATACSYRCLILPKTSPTLASVWVSHLKRLQLLEETCGVKREREMAIFRTLASVGVTVQSKIDHTSHADCLRLWLWPLLHVSGLRQWCMHRQDWSHIMWACTFASLDVHICTMHAQSAVQKLKIQLWSSLTTWWFCSTPLPPYPSIIQVRCELCNIIVQG